MARKHRLQFRLENLAEKNFGCNFATLVKFFCFLVFGFFGFLIYLRFSQAEYYSFFTLGAISNFNFDEKLFGSFKIKLKNQSLEDFKKYFSFEVKLYQSIKGSNPQEI